MRFSERKGYKEVSKIIQLEGLDSEIRTALWNLFYDRAHLHFHLGHDNIFPKLYWTSFKKGSLDTTPASIQGEVKSIFENDPWYELYDFIEFFLNYLDQPDINELLNGVLERELSGYRFVSGQITDIHDKQEIEMLESALSDDEFPNVKAHLQRALELLSDRKNPDYRNSIKESISAVESMAKEIAGKPKVELGDALKEIENQGKLHGAMKKAFLSLYGYTSDANGIRHALMAESNLTADDAKFFLMSCTSFINYLKAKM